MKASGLSLAVFALAAIVAAPSYAGPRFAPRPLIKMGQRSGDADRGHHRYSGNDAFFPGGYEGPSDPPDAAPTVAPQQIYATENVYVAAPVEPTRWEPSRPRIILLGVRRHARPSRPLPEVIYGDVRP
jgi:hypothetical protein